MSMILLVRLDRGLIQTCIVRPIVVNPLSVSIQSNGKKRLILDLRSVNKHLWKQSIKYTETKKKLSPSLNVDMLVQFFNAFETRCLR
jgi:hypothetical protein